MSRTPGTSTEGTAMARKAKPAKLTPAQLAHIQERTRRLLNQLTDRFPPDEPVCIIPATPRRRRTR